jgi:predicted NBD/HSP70 family sugar kinase
MESYLVQCFCSGHELERRMKAGSDYKQSNDSLQQHMEAGKRQAKGPIKEFTFPLRRMLDRTNIIITHFGCPSSLMFPLR